jgi:hypothetical protein
MRFGAAVDLKRPGSSASRGGTVRHIERRGRARPASGPTEPIGLSASTPGTRRFATIAHGYKMTHTHSENPSIVTADISKWISGESDAFFDLPQTPPSVTADSNPGAERSTARPSIRRFVHPAIAAVVGAVTLVASVCFVIPMRHSVEPLSAADAKSQPSDDGATSTIARPLENAGWSKPLTSPPTEIIPTPVMPPLNQPTTTLSSAQVAAFLSEVGAWYDRRTKAAPVSERRPSSPQRATSR